MGLALNRMIFLGDASVQEIFESVIEQIRDNALVVGMGNIGGSGLELARYFRNRSAVGVLP